MSETLEQVVLKYRKNHNDELGRMIWEECLPIVRSKAKGIVRSAPYRLTVDDLTQDAWLGIQRAIVAFDPTRRVKFKAFAARHILGRMLDALRTPRRRNYKSPKYVSSYVHSCGETDGILLSEAVDHLTGDPFDNAFGLSLIEDLTASLKGRDRKILRMFYGQGMTMRKIGRKIGVSESRVSQLRKEALSIVRFHWRHKEEELCCTHG